MNENKQQCGKVSNDSNIVNDKKHDETSNVNENDGKSIKKEIEVSMVKSAVLDESIPVDENGVPEGVSDLHQNESEDENDGLTGSVEVDGIPVDENGVPEGVSDVLLAPPASVGDLQVKRKKIPLTTPEESEKEARKIQEEHVLTGKQNVQSSGKVRESKFLGLSNQGATCYLNSLLQTLFMTPDIRNALYKWRHDATKGTQERSIPYQLQKIFVRLEKSTNKDSVSTKNLTAAFGWNQRESFVQHDVNELCRVLFDALDKTFSPELYRMNNELMKSKDAEEKKIIQEKYKDIIEDDGMISDLYSGVMVDFIQAIGDDGNPIADDEGKPIGREIEETFMDLQLVVRGVKNVEESLKNYFTLETLKDDYQWYAEPLKRKVNALKGYRAKTFPKILTLHLKRFDYDRTTWTRIKLGHKVEFPLVLDTKPYLPKDTKGPTKYDLFSVMVHDGSARRGHYFAFIKDIEEGKWYEFNDTSVKEIQVDDVKEMFGDDKNAMSETSKNAYMLMYRLIEPNQPTFIRNTIPQDLLDEVQKENEAYEKELKEMEIRRNTVHSRIFFPFAMKDQTKGHAKVEISCLRQRSFDDFYNEVYNHFAKQDWWSRFNISRNNFRLREFDTYNGSMEKLYDSNSKKSLESLGFYTVNHLIVEHKKEEDEWEVNERYFDVYCHILDTSKPLNNPVIKYKYAKGKKLKLNAAWTLIDLKKILSEELPENPIDLQRIHIFRKVFNSNKNYVLTDFPDNANVEVDLGLSEYDSIYVEVLDVIDKKIEEPQGMKTIDYENNYYEVYVNRPDSDKFDIMIPCHKQSTLEDFKNAISEQIDVNPSEFRIFTRNTRISLDENLSQKMIVAPGIFNNSEIVVERGESMKPGEFIVQVYQFKSEKEYIKMKQKKDKLQYLKKKQRDGENVGEYIAKEFDPIIPQRKREALFKELGKFIIHNKMTLGEFKAMVIQKIPNVDDIDRLRVRVKSHSNVKKPLWENDTPLVVNYPSLAKKRSKTQFVVQVLREKESIPKGSMIIRLSQWKQDVWKFGLLEEFIFHPEKILSTDDLRDAIAEFVGIPKDKIGMHKAPSGLENWPPNSKACEDIALLDWNYSQQSLYIAPFRLKNGNIVLWTDTRIEEKYDLQQLAKKYGPNRYCLSYSTKKPSEQEKETQLKIRTEFDEKK